MLKQKTLRGSFSLNGKGLHTGVNLTVTFNPAPDNHGYKIQRIDLEGQPIIDAVAENVGDTTRGTVLMKNGIKVSTVEHALAALYAAGIDNCLIQVSGPEFPILDGSAKAYVENIQRVGIEEQNAVKIPHRGSFRAYLCIRPRNRTIAGCRTDQGRRSGQRHRNLRKRDEPRKL